MVERELSVAGDTRLVRCEQKGAAIAWPIPLDNFLDGLVDACDDVGQPTSRKELAAAILFAASRDGEELSQLLLNYRRAFVADVAPAEAQGENVIPFQVKRPGPRPRRGVDRQG